MFNPQPTWGAPQAYNTGTFNPFSFAAFNPLSLKNIVPGSQQTNQDQKPQTPLQNGHRGSFSDSLSQPSNVSVPPVTKAPPGIPSASTPSFPLPASSLLNLNSILKQPPPVNVETKLKSTSNSNVTTAASSSDRKSQFAYAAAAPPPPNGNIFLI